MTHRSLEIEGVRLRWHEVGSGRPTILVHGIPTSYLLWRHVVPRLEGAHAIAWEVPGCGSSMQDPLPDDLSVTAQAEFLAAMMNSEGLGGGVLVGHGFGGGIAQMLAARHPDLVGGLVLIDSVAYTPWDSPCMKSMRKLRGILRRAPRGMVRWLFRRAILRGHDDRVRGHESVDEHWAFYAATASGSAIARQLRLLRTTEDTADIVSQLRRMDIPTRVAWGVSDPYQPVDVGRRLAIDLSAPLDPINGGRHFTPEDHPERVAAAINSLLRELAQSRPQPVPRNRPTTRSSKEARAR